MAPTKGTIAVVDHVERMLLDLNDEKQVTYTKDGYLVAVPRIARTGIQLYRGWEMGLEDKDATVRVYRPESAVFDVDALRSLAFRPVTLDHPPEMVDAKNWRKWAVGQLGGDFARDGQFIRFPMTIMDGKAVQAVKDGQAELSVGYRSEIVWEDGTTPDGQPYDAVQTSISANHVALVGLARGGHDLKIGDKYKWRGEEEEEEEEEGETKKKKKGMPFGKKDSTDLRNADRSAGRAREDASAADRTRTHNERRKAMSDVLRAIVVDGVSVEVPEISAQVVVRALQDRDDANKALKTQVDQREAADKQTLADQRKLIDTKDGEIAALKRQLAELEMTPAKLDKLVRDRLEIVEKARLIMGDAYICDGRTDIEIQRAVVSARLGEQIAKALTDEGISGAFVTLTADSKGNGGTARDLATGISANRGRTAHSAMDAAAIAYEERNKRLNNAWRKEQKTA